MAVYVRVSLLVILGFVAPGTALLLNAQSPCTEQVSPQIRIDPGHPWRPPFGLDRVGKPLVLTVELRSASVPMREYYLTGIRNGQESVRIALNFKGGNGLFTGSASINSFPDQVVLSAKCRYQGEETELLRMPIHLPDIEAEAIAHPEKQINPVDLGTVLVPDDWLLLGAGQKAIVDVAAVLYHRNVPNGRVKAWFESSPTKVVERSVVFEEKKRSVTQLELGPLNGSPAKNILHVAILDAAGGELWRKQIRTMFVERPLALPSFGAIETKLRYDAPISVRDAGSGRLSQLNYDRAWRPELKDIVVALPNGSRFVFWRGSSYIPFWAGLHNTGFTYEWAETTPPPDGFVDSVEPLMDKELRYGRVQIVESTPSRVHVKWSYQSTDFMYKVWGDAAVEDFYFYPDGFGTRILSLKSAPGADYELSEFIILTAQSTYPLQVLPRTIADLIYLDGFKEEVSFPFRPKAGATKGFLANKLENYRGIPIVYRLHIHRDDRATPIYFYPGDLTMPIAYNPFYDRGYLVTPAYWGSHWPLGRGTSTGNAIDDRIYSNPGHNSFLTWGMGNRPIPIDKSQIESIDTLGHSKPMTIQRWAWLIALTDVSDRRLIDWAQSFSHPPSVELTGAKLEFNDYATERRAIRLQAEKKVVTIVLKPVSRCINPVIEISAAPGNLASIDLNGRVLGKQDYAWDGHTLWVNATIDLPSQLTLHFE